MEKIELTPEEQIELEKREFLVKKLMSLYDFFKDIIIWTIVFGLLGWVMGWVLRLYYTDTEWINGIVQYASIIPLLLQIQHLLNWILGGKLFFWETHILVFWKILNSINNINQGSYISGLIRFIRNNISFRIPDGSYVSEFAVAIFLYIPILMFISISYWISPLSHNTINLIILIIPIIYLFILIIRFFLEIFHPLYAFGNLWEKIKKLTPKIEEKSKEIQENFQKDMNFKILSDGFDSLSSTFSEIISLVIKLEKIESRANKWDLFDSDKYINSLRTDIIEPLISLRSFLEKQKIELKQSGKELTSCNPKGVNHWLWSYQRIWRNSIQWSRRWGNKKSSQIEKIFHKQNYPITTQVVFSIERSASFILYFASTSPVEPSAIAISFASSP